MKNDKLYIEFRVNVPQNAHPEMLDEIAQIMQERIYDMFEEAKVEHDGMPSCLDVTYELVREVMPKDID